MTKQNILMDNNSGVLEAIYHRRAVRTYLPQKLDKNTIEQLLDAAVHAPTAMHEEPWGFVVIEDKALLNQLSENAKALLSEATSVHIPSASSHFTNPEFNVFYDATTLIVIYGKPLGNFVIADCWLAAENLMLAAYSMGLGSCVIGLAVAALNTPKWKSILNIPREMTAFAPIIVGVPRGETALSPRNKPPILYWK